ncbi:hypothetical protein J2Y89_002385 [Curtobacterium herbarum]|nr:hypothetical protein [Curtobacterium herbarum]
MDHHRADLRGLERELVRRGLCRPAFGIKLKAASASRSAFGHVIGSRRRYPLRWCCASTTDRQ